MPRTLVSDDIEEIPYPDQLDLEALTVDEIVKVHYQCWRSINVTEVYSMDDVRQEMSASAKLNDLGVTFQPQFPQYRIPNQPNRS